MAYTITSNILGLMPIANFDSGVTYPNASSAAPTSPMKLGMIITAVDPTYGQGEFILLPGVASTAIGSVVSYNTTTYATALVAATTALPVLIAVAMSANIVSTTWGWYQISGIAVCKKASATLVTAGKPVGIQTAGLVNATAVGLEVQGSSVATTFVTGTTGLVMLNRPHKQGRIT